MTTITITETTPLGDTGCWVDQTFTLPKLLMEMDRLDWLALRGGWNPMYCLEYHLQSMRGCLEFFADWGDGWAGLHEEVNREYDDAVWCLERAR